MAGISSKALAFGNPNNRKGYVGNEIQNKEFIDGSGLDFYDFNARTYDQQIGRFIQIDPLSEEADQEGWSPFHYSYDNPVTYSDPDGKCPCLIIPVVQAITAAVVAGTTTYVVVKSYENSDLDLNLSLPAATGTGTARPAMTGSAAQLDFAVERQLNNNSRDFGKNSTSQGTAAGGVGAQAGRALAKGNNPYGAKGKPDHQEKVKELEKKAQSEAGPKQTVVRERKIQGHDSRRKPDVQIVDKDGKTIKIYEAERKPESKRNKVREEEYKKLKISNETHKVGK